MTAVVSAERAARTWLTGASGLLIVVIAFVMMAWASPSHPHARPHQPAISHSVTADRLASPVWAGAMRPPENPAARRSSAARR